MTLPTAKSQTKIQEKGGKGKSWLKAIKFGKERKHSALPMAHCLASCQKESFEAVASHWRAEAESLLCRRSLLGLCIFGFLGFVGSTSVPRRLSQGSAAGFWRWKGIRCIFVKSLPSWRKHGLVKRQNASCSQKERTGLRFPIGRPRKIFALHRKVC